MTKIPKPCIIKRHVIMLNNRFLFIKTWLLLVCGTGIYVLTYGLYLSLGTRKIPLHGFFSCVLFEALVPVNNFSVILGRLSGFNQY